MTPPPLGTALYMPAVVTVRNMRQGDHKREECLVYKWVPGQKGILSEIVSQLHSTINEKKKTDSNSL